MTRLLLISLFLLSAAPAYAEWVEVDGNDQAGVNVYAKPDTIRRKAEMVTMWILFDFKTAQTTNGGGVRICLSRGKRNTTVMENAAGT